MSVYDDIHAEAEHDRADNLEREDVSDIHEEGVPAGLRNRRTADGLWLLSMTREFGHGGL